LIQEMNFDEALSYLLSLGHETLTIKLGLTNTETLLAALGNPYQHFRSVQIAGTNGKGSTAVMLASICRAAGVRVGLFTSPHLISITERIILNGQEISPEEFARYTSIVKATADGLVADGQLQALPTFFEHITAIALLAFREAGIELAVLETGLGGRLDSTTAAGAEVVAITPIAMDHQEYLGNTLAEIAAEKAAIIRPGVTAIVAPQKAAAMDVIVTRAAGGGVEPQLVQSDCAEFISASTDGRCCVTFKTDRDTYEKVLLGLRGRHQMVNAATVIALAEALRERGFSISKNAIVNGLENARHAGRLELWPAPTRMLFDGAHNPAAAQALHDYLYEFVTEPITMIFGAMRDKELDEMAALLFPKADELILTSMDNPRAATAGLLFEVAHQVIDEQKISQVPSPLEALKLAKQLTGGADLICVTGSLYLVGTMQDLLRSRISVVPV
jgi:dihydrofolate synthase / folylpolyglutamate synthase